MININLQQIKTWLLNQSKKHTVQDAAMFILAGLLLMVLKPITGLIATASIAYGIWIIVRDQLKFTNGK